MTKKLQLQFYLVNHKANLPMDMSQNLQNKYFEEAVKSKTKKWYKL